MTADLTERFSTHSLEEWTETLNRFQPSLVLRTGIGDEAFNAKLQVARARRVALMAMSGPRLTARRTDQLIATGDDQQLTMIWQLKGVGIATQNGRRLVLNCGDAVLLRLDRPYSFECATQFRQLVLTVHADEILRKPGSAKREIEAIAASRISPLGPSAPWLAFIKELWNQVNHGGTKVLESLYVPTIDALTTLVCENEDRIVVGQPDNLANFTFERAAVLIESRYRDPDLSVDSIARQICVSRRTLFRAFAQQGESLGRYVTQYRLDKAAAGLAGTSKPVSIVATESGFRSPSAFYSNFRRRFGLTPEQYRDREAHVLQC